MKVLEFLFKLRDQFRTPAQRVINTIRSLTQVEQAATRGLAKFGRMLSSLRVPAQVTVGALNRLRSAALGLAFGAAAFTAVGFGAALAGKGIIDSAAYKEQTLISFTSILGDATKASNLYANAVSFAARTPFNDNDIIDATKSLLAYGFATSDLESILTSAGNLASGMGKPLEQVTTAFAALKGGDFGQAFGVGQGFSQLGITKDMLSAGGLKFDKKGSYVGSVEDAMKVVQEIIGKRFGKGMEAQSKSILGLVSTLQSRSSQLFGSLLSVNGKGEFAGPLAPFRTLLENLANLTDFDKAPGAGIKAQFKESIGGLMGIIFGAGNNLTGGNKGKQLVEGVVGSWRKINLWFRANGGKISAVLRTVAVTVSKAIGVAIAWFKANGPALWQAAQQVFKEFIGAVQMALVWLRAEGPKIWQAAKQIFAGIVTAIRIAIPIVKALAPFTPQIIAFFLAFKAAQAIVGVVTVVQKFATALAGLPGRIQEAIGGINRMAASVRRAATAFWSATVRAYGFVVSMIRVGVTAVANATRGIGMFIVQVVRLGAQLLVTAVSSIATFVGGMIRMGVTALLTGARMAAAWLIGLGPVGWIILAITAIGGAFVLLYNKVSWFRAFVDASWQFIKNGAMALWAYFGTLPAAFAQVWLTIQGTFNNTIAWFQGLPERFVQFGANIIQGIIDGITSKIAAVRDTILGVAGSIGDWFSGSGGIDARSPSRVFTVKGSFISSGIEQGILGGRKQVAAAIKTLAAGAAITASVALQPTAAALSMPGVSQTSVTKTISPKAPNPKPFAPKPVQMVRTALPKPLKALKPFTPRLPEQLTPVLPQISIPVPKAIAAETQPVVQPRLNSAKEKSSSIATIKLEVKVSGDGTVSNAGMNQIGEVSVEQVRAALEQMGYEIGG